MDRREKEHFIYELMIRVQADIMKAIPKMPDDWDGHELRRYIADKFEDAAITVGRKGHHGRDYRKRTRAYRAVVLERNL